MTATSLAERIGWRRAGLAVALVAFVALAVQALVKPDAEWAQVFVPAARDLWAGRDFYGPGTLYLYPPFGALVGLLFAPLPDWAVRLTWYVIDVAAIVALAGAAWRISGGGALAAPSPATRDAWIVVALGAVITAPFAWNTLVHQQADLVIDALVALGALAVLRGRPLVGGVAIGLAAAFKGPPLLFAVYFLWRRDWLAALAVAATAIGVNLIPDLISPAPEGTWVGLWLTRWVLPATKVTTALGSWGTELIYNQSLSGTVQRLANTALVPRDGGGLRVVAVAEPVATLTLKAITYGLMAALAVVTLAASVLGDRAARTRPLPAPPSARAVELAIVPMLMLLISPMSGLAHFPVVALPALVLARIAVVEGDWTARVGVALALALALAVNKDLVGGRAYDAILWSGAGTFTGLVLWATCVAVLARGRARAPVVCD